MLPIHITSALISFIFAFYTAFAPSITKIRITYFLTGTTLLSGLVLAITSASSITKTCISGLVYIGLMLYLSLSARKRLSLQSEKVF